jgi:putative flippase GtrA
LSGLLEKNPRLTPESFRQFFKFGIVGLSNTALSLLIYYVLVAVDLDYLLANVAAFVVSVLNAYYWNNRFVFRKSTAGHLRPLLKTYLSYGATFLVSSGLLYVMIDLLGISKMIAPILNLTVTIPLNFLANKYWAFK